MSVAGSFCFFLIFLLTVLFTKRKMMCSCFTQIDRSTPKSNPGDPENALFCGQEKFSGTFDPVLLQIQFWIHFYVSCLIKAGALTCLTTVLSQWVIQLTWICLIIETVAHGVIDSWFKPHINKHRAQMERLASDEFNFAPSQTGFRLFKNPQGRHQALKPSRGNFHYQNLVLSMR